jgi:hypothetical protein
MRVSGKLPSTRNRSSSSKRPRRRRQIAPFGRTCDWLLEERCLLAGGPPYPFPTPTVDSLGKVFYDGVTGQYQKSITITNNSNQVIYGFLEGQNSRLAIAPYTGTGAFDPYDPANHEYRAYVGYSDGATSYAGLKPHTSITMTVPLVFWDSGRFIFSTDGAAQFNDAPGAAAVGAPFYYHSANTQATYFASVDANSNRLNFTPIYTSFDSSSDHKPTTAHWQSPVTQGLLKTGMTVTGPGLAPGGYKITVDSSHPGYVTLAGNATASASVDQYTFTSESGKSISPTARYISTGLPLKESNGSATTKGAVMWYHALKANAPNNDAPFQLTEVTFRGDFYNPKINTTTGFQYLLGNKEGEGIDANDFDLIDYDISFVDSINMPIAMAARDAVIPHTNVRAPFGWVGSAQSLEDFQKALGDFTKPNTNGKNINGLGEYFGGKGYPSYLLIDQGNIKLPAGQNLFLASPVNPGGGLADIFYTKTFNDGSKIQAPVYALTSAGDGPSQLSLGGDSAHPSHGQFLGLYTSNDANKFALNSLIAPNVAAGRKYVVTYNIHGTDKTAKANVIDMYYASDNKTIIGVKLDQAVQGDAANQVYNFQLPPDDYADRAIASLWYSWANYYATQVSATPRNNVAGTIKAGSYVLTLSQPTPGLVPGMAVTSGGLSAGSVILSVGTDNRTITLSTVATAAGSSFNFAAPDVKALVGYDPNGYTPIKGIRFEDVGQKTFALAFAETVYVVMSAWNTSVPAGTAHAWNPLLTNIIGGNLGKNFLPHANEDIVKILTVKSKSALRGVPDYTSPLYSDPARWYPDPAQKTGNQTFNVYNLNPFVWFIHAKLGLSGYAFALDDDIGNVGAGGATQLDITIGGLNGITNRDPYTPVAPFGVVTTKAAASPAKSSLLANLSNANLVNQISPFDYNHNLLGSLINGEGVQLGSTIQFTQINEKTPANTRLVLSRPLGSATSGTTDFAFFGSLVFPGKVLGQGQPTDTIYLDNEDAYNTLLKLGPLHNIQVNGPGIPIGTVVTIKQVLKSGGTFQVQLSRALQTDLVSQPGTSYGYTFGNPFVVTVRDLGFEWATVQGLVDNFNHGKQVSQNTVDWTFTDSTTNPAWFAGIAANGSKFTKDNPEAFQGVQVGFITGDSSITQTVTLGTGTYKLTFRAAQRAISQAPQTLNVLVDGISVGTITPKNSNYDELYALQFTVKAGKHTITFRGTQKSDSTALIDAILCNPVTPAPRVGFVQNLYQDVLERPARPPEEKRWVRFLKGGGSLRAMTLALVTSTGYRRRHLTARAFVAGLYRDVLGRQADSAELAHWLKFARARRGNRLAIAKAFLNAPESRVSLRKLYEQG